jgi:stearoyl-CoA desaturase (delta-9 desaturase)
MVVANRKTVQKDTKKDFEDVVVTKDQDGISKSDPCTFDGVEKIGNQDSYEWEINWPMSIYIAVIHVGAAVGLYYLQDAKWQTLVWAFILWPISGYGITGGAHRLWAHRSYKAAPSVRFITMLMNSIANQGSIYHWARDHRVHHKYSETDADPHNATRGFFFAHMGWLLVKKHPKVKEAGEKLNFDDLLADKFVAFQKRYDPWFAMFMCFFFPAFVAQYFWGENFWTAYWVAGFTRYVAVLHFTWLVNSAAHFFGDRPYDPKINPTENAAVAVASLGEGWHNWHHKYPYDYAASEFGADAAFNPTKLLIDTFAKLGLVHGRKRALGAWEILKQSRSAKVAEKTM